MVAESPQAALAAKMRGKPLWFRRLVRRLVRARWDKEAGREHQDPTPGVSYPKGEEQIGPDAGDLKLEPPKAVYRVLHLVEGGRTSATPESER